MTQEQTNQTETQQAHFNSNAGVGWERQNGISLSFYVDTLDKALAEAEDKEDEKERKYIRVRVYRVENSDKIQYRAKVHLDNPSTNQ